MEEGCRTDERPWTGASDLLVIYNDHKELRRCDRLTVINYTDLASQHQHLTVKELIPDWRQQHSIDPSSSVT